MPDNPEGELYGVWGGRYPGGWCHFVSGPDLPLHREFPYWGTREQAERTLAVFKEENPDLPYEIMPFDHEKEPEANPRKVTAVQLRALAVIEHEESSHLRGDFTRATYGALLERGLAMHKPSLRGPLRLTRAGKALLEKHRST